MNDNVDGEVPDNPGHKPKVPMPNILNIPGFGILGTLPPELRYMIYECLQGETELGVAGTSQKKKKLKIWRFGGNTNWRRGRTTAFPYPKLAAVSKQLRYENLRIFWKRHTLLVTVQIKDLHFLDEVLTFMTGIEPAFLPEELEIIFNGADFRVGDPNRGGSLHGLGLKHFPDALKEFIQIVRKFGHLWPKKVRISHGVGDMEDRAFYQVSPEIDEWYSEVIRLAKDGKEDEIKNLQDPPAR